MCIGEERLKLVPYFKYLGITILHPKFQQAHNVSNPTNMLQNDTSRKIKEIFKGGLLIYKSMLLPYFDYADIIFCRANHKDVGKLQTLQNKCLRICMGKDRRFDTNRAHKLSNVPFLKDRREAHVCNFMYKRKSKPGLLNRREIRTRAHDAPLFIVPIPRCEAFKRSVIYHGSYTWNNLGVKVRNSKNYLSFKNIQKQSMFLPLKAIQ